MDATLAENAPHAANAPLGDLDFSYQVTRERTVFIRWRGRTVLTVTGQAAEQLLERLDGLDPAATQIVLAKATGNFKRGNERGR